MSASICASISVVHGFPAACRLEDGFALGTTATIFKFGTTAAKAVNCTSSEFCEVLVPKHMVGTVVVTATVRKVKSSFGSGPSDKFTYS
jgi:hypothetical protein